MSKSWYLSKTLWLNVIGVLIEVAQVALDMRWLSTQTLAGVMAILNIILRLLTKTELVK